MKQKTPLMLLELSIMVLVFALAAVMCLQVFVYCENQSDWMERQDRAVLLAQNTAEVLKQHGGDFALAAADFGGRVEPDGSWSIGYDENWIPTGQQPVFLLTVRPVESVEALLGQADIVLQDRGGTALFSLTVFWQKGSDVHEN